MNGRILLFLSGDDAVDKEILFEETKREIERLEKELADLENARERLAAQIAEENYSDV